MVSLFAQQTEAKNQKPLGHAHTQPQESPIAEPIASYHRLRPYGSAPYWFDAGASMRFVGRAWRSQVR